MQKIPRSGPELLAYLYAGQMVEEMNIGGTRVRFFDTAYRDATPEELEKRRSRINAAAWDCVRSWTNNGEDEPADGKGTQLDSGGGVLSGREMG